MNPHDVFEIAQSADGSWTVLCACGSSFTREGRQDALDSHLGHFGVEKAREALRKEPGA